MGISNRSGITIGADGLPPGGAIDQVLTKASADNFDVIWADIGGGGGSFIKLDGTSTTTAIIPFAEGISVTATGGAGVDVTCLDVVVPKADTTFGLRFQGDYTDCIRGDGIAGDTFNASISNFFFFQDNTQFTPQAAGKSYWSFSTFPFLTGTQNVSSFYGHLAGPATSATGSTYSGVATDVVAYKSLISWRSGTATTYTMFDGSVSSVTGTINNLYGLKLGDITVGSSSNYAIYTGLGDVSFGDDVTMRTGTFDWNWASGKTFDYDTTTYTGDYSVPIVRFLDPIISAPGGLSPGDPRAYFDPIWGFSTISYINIAGAWMGSGSTFRILGPFQTDLSTGKFAYMLGVRSDIQGATVQIACSSDTANYALLSGINYIGGTPTANFAIDRDGSLWWGSTTNIGNGSNLVTALPVDMGMDVHLYRDGGLLRLNTAFTCDDVVSVAETITVSGTSNYSHFGESWSSTVITPGSSNDRLVVGKVQTTNAVARAGLFVAEWAGSGTVTVGINGLNAAAVVAPSNSSNITTTSAGGGLRAGRYIVRHDGSGTVTMASTFSGICVAGTSGAIITDSAVYHSESPTIAATTTWATHSGLWVRGGTVSGTITTRYGARIDNLLSAGTNNYGLFIAEQTGPTDTGANGPFELFLDAGGGAFFREKGNQIYSSASATLDIDATTTQNQRIGGTTKLALTTSALTFSDAVNIVVNTSTGTKIGTGTTQKIGFWNATPVVQPASTGTTTAGFTANTSANAVFAESTFTGNTGSTAYTISDIVRNFKTAGLLAA